MPIIGSRKYTESIWIYKIFLDRLWSVEFIPWFFLALLFIQLSHKKRPLCCSPSKANTTIDERIATQDTGSIGQMYAWLLQKKLLSFLRTNAHSDTWCTAYCFSIYNIECTLLVTRNAIGISEFQLIQIIYKERESEGVQVAIKCWLTGCPLTNRRPDIITTTDLWRWSKAGRANGHS